MKLVTLFLSTSYVYAIPPEATGSKSCPDLTNWTQGKRQKDYDNAPSGVKVYKYLTTTSSKVPYYDADAQCEYEFGGYVVSANLKDEEQNEYIFGNNSPLSQSKTGYWFNSFLSTFGLDGKNGGGCDGIHLCWNSWRRCKQNSGGQQCTPYGSDVEFNHYFTHAPWDTNGKNCVGYDTTNGRDTSCKQTFKIWNKTQKGRFRG